MRRIRTAVVELADDLPDLDLEQADEWRVLVTDDGVPLHHIITPSPGAGGRAALEMVVRRHAATMQWEEALCERYRTRYGPPPGDPPPLRISVVVPTHRRPELLARLLETVRELDPPPDEVVVVDHLPGDRDCRAVVEHAGARYVREDRGSLNVARASGVRAASGDVVAFTDDDCLLTPRWLAALPELFADPLVGVVAGPAFPHELETGAQLRRDEEAGFDKGMRRRRFRRHNTAPAHAGVVGSGNSMALRRAPALALGVFPPDIEAGSPAPGGGDLYAIYRFLAAGYEAVYEPRMVLFHQHPRSDLKRVIRNYGVGVGAYYTKVLVEGRELAVFRLWYWVVRRWVEAVVDALVLAVPDRGRVRVRWEYLAASLRGPYGWWQALRVLDEAGRAELEASRAVQAGIKEHASRNAGGRIAGYPRWEEQFESFRRRPHADPWRTIAYEAAERPPVHTPACDLRVDEFASSASEPTAFWNAANAAVVASTADAVLIPLPGVEAGLRWRAEVAPALGGSRVAAVVGAGLDERDPPAPLHLFARVDAPSWYPAIGNPPQYVAVRRDLHVRLGGFDVRTAAIGMHAPLADYLERALGSGLVVGRLDTHDLAPVGTRRPARSRGEWERMRARGGLLARDARRRGGVAGFGLLFWSGLVPLVRFRRVSALERKGVRHAAGSLAAFAAGAARGLRS